MPQQRPAAIAAATPVAKRLLRVVRASSASGVVASAVVIVSAAGRLSPQLDGLGDVAGADLFAGGKVGDGARDLLDAVEGARREAEPGSGLLQQCRPGLIGLAVCVDVLRRQPGVRLALPGLLAGECCGDTPAYVFRAFAVGRLLQRFGGNGRHVDVEVDAIEQRPRELPR